MTSVHYLKGLISRIRQYSPYILGAIKEGFDNSSIVSMVREISDVPIRNQEIGKSVNVIRRANDGWDLMKFTRKNAKIGVGYQLTDRFMPQRFSTVIKSSVMHETTGERQTVYTTVWHDELATRADLESRVVDVLTDFGNREYLRVESQQPVMGFESK